MNDQPVTATQIADLLARARTLTTPSAAATPADRAAYLAAKADLLARIVDQHAHDWQPDHADQAQQIAQQARAAAAQARHPTPSESGKPGGAKSEQNSATAATEHGAKSEANPGAIWG